MKSLAAITQETAAKEAKRLRHRKYEWFRFRNDFPDLPIWRAVARRCKVPVHQVVALVVRIDALANKSSPRGSVADFSITEFAAALDLRPDVVARIRVALEEADIAWIDQDFVVDFYQRNPDEEDPTAVDRQRRHRAKLKQAAALDGAAGVRGPPPGYPQSRVVTRDNRDVTARSDQSLTKGLSEKNFGASGAAIADAGVHSDSGDSGGSTPLTRDQAELWLAVHGEKIVAGRTAMTKPWAAMELERFAKQLGGNLTALAAIVHAADLTGNAGGAFMDFVRREIGRHQFEANGPGLPLKTSLRSSRHG